MLALHITPRYGHDIDIFFLFSPLKRIFPKVLTIDCQHKQTTYVHELCGSLRRNVTLPKTEQMRWFWGKSLI